MNKKQSPITRQIVDQLNRFAWLPILLSIFAIAALWIADMHIILTMPILFMIVHYGSAVVCILIIVVTAGRIFVDSGQPGMLMIGCAILIIAIGTVAMPVAVLRSTSCGFAIFNTSALLSALCHFTGMLITSKHRISLRRSAVWWLAVAYAVSAAIMGLVIWLTFTDRMPVFFIDGYGGTPLRSAVVFLAVMLFLLTAGILWQTNRHKESPFFYWYAQGLVLVAIGLAGSAIIVVRDSPIQWVTRFTQVFGMIYICVAVLLSLRENRCTPLPLSAVEDTWRGNAILDGLRHQTMGVWVLDFGLAVVAVAVAMAVRQGLTAWFGPGLPTYITLYPAVMTVAVLAGFMSGAVATLLAAVVVGYWILPPLEQFAISSSVDRLGLVIFIGMGLFMSIFAELSWRRKNKAMAYDREMALIDARSRLATFAEATFEGIVESLSGRIVDCNEQFARMTNYPVSELRGMEIADLIVPEDRDRVMSNISQHRESVSEYTMFRKDGTRITVEAHGRSAFSDNRVRHTALRDITEQKNRERKLQQLNRTLNALSNSIEVMIHAKDEDAYLQKVCKIIIEDCQHTMAWIGYAENDIGQSVKPVASAGFEAGYLETLQITWADTERGRGPTGTAIRTGQITTCRNMVTDPLFAPWREESLNRGYASSIVLPLMAEGTRFGAVSIYSTQPDPFSEDEVALLKKLADDLAFGIVSLRLRIERSKSDQLLQESQSLLDSTQRLAKIGGWNYDNITHRVIWTKEVYRIFGVSPDEFDPNDFSLVREFFAPSDRERLEQAFSESLNKGIPYDLEFSISSTDGRQLWVHIVGQPVFHDGQVVSTYGNIMDITELHDARSAIESANLDLEMRIAERTEELINANEELICEVANRRNAEDSLRESEARWRRYMESAPYGIFVGDEKGKFLQVNPEACRISGYDETELLYLGIPDLLASDSKRKGLNDFAELIKSRRIYGEYQCVTRSGEQRWWSVAAVMIQGGRFLGFISDITERRRIEAELKSSEKRYRTLIDTTPDLIYSLDRKGRYLVVNRALCDAFELNENQIIGRRYNDVGIPEDLAREWEKLDRRVLSGETVHDETRITLPKSGSHTYDTMLYPIVGQDGSITGLTGISRDITKQRKVEEQFFQSQRMEAVGRLAGGVAHDFNNMLSVIIGSAELALIDIDSNHPLYCYLSEIMGASQRSADLTRQLLAFARKQTVVPEIIDLNQTISGMLKMLQRLIGEDIEIIWKPGANLWPVLIDPSQVDQVLANLSVNARDAISGTGSLIIETENVIIDEVYCALHPDSTQGSFVMLAVSDNGCGMDKETAEHIFEPFFTTKETGKGTGLGLATVFGIVQQNKGFIHVYSESGEGTTFKIYLSRFEGLTGKKVIPETESLPKGNHETILVVEDEPRVLNLSKSILEALGYRVLVAGNSRDAISLAEKHREEIQLLLTDVVMPGMNGRELSARILELIPELRCLFMSGYTANVIAHHGVLDEGIHFVPKPLKMRELATSIKAVLKNR